jgi:membrane protease YdiL (CAAX protease family)
LWLAYTILQTLFVMGTFSDTWSAIFGFLPGLLGLGVLLAAGLSRRECFLRVQPLSRRGLAALAAVFVFALAAILPLSVWQGWSWRAALLYAPASGISQELFFRSVLLPALLLVLKGRRALALVLHSVLFGLWHIGPLFLGAPPWAVLAVMFVPFLSGLGWGWQVLRDRTVLWAMIQHSLIWVVCLQFAQPA